ncbi:hypothetical protein [Burkholderia thailandensis]|uniref:hypothetical protein n=1 Tax=Burkholderia thailandensis TaxID=57975 RepID=UPI0012D36332|nr:hypothetical protein [Burkholderia thailandensis]MCZ2900475.1 hypothetical protein [Burkholderia thailandensis]
MFMRVHRCDRDASCMPGARALRPAACVSIDWRRAGESGAMSSAGAPPIAGERASISLRCARRGSMLRTTVLILARCRLIDACECVLRILVVAIDPVLIDERHGSFVEWGASALD